MDRVRTQMPAADENIRLVQIALQEVMDEERTTFANCFWPTHISERLQKGLRSQSSPDNPHHRVPLVTRFVEKEGFQTSSNIHQDDFSDPQDLGRSMVDKHMELRMRSNSETRSRSSLSQIDPHSQKVTSRCFQHGDDRCFLTQVPQKMVHVGFSGGRCVVPKIHRQSFFVHGTRTAFLCITDSP